LAKPKEKLSNIKTHTVYKVGKRRVPGVTTVLGVLAKPALIHWAWDLGCQGIDYKKFRDSLANAGSLAHYLVQCELTGEEPDTSSYSKEIIDLAENAVLKFYEWQKHRKIEVVLVEEPLVSEEHMYGGTADCVAVVDGELTLIDIKTSKRIYPEMVTQLSAYLKLLEENGYGGIQTARILRIGRTEDEGFEEQVFRVADLADHWSLFEHCLSVYQLKKKIGV
jgi:hypothetical protein